MQEQGYREIGPDGTITLFKDLLRRLGEAVPVHIGPVESRDRGEVECAAIFFTATNRYCLRAVQEPDRDRSRLICIVSGRVAPADPDHGPLRDSSRALPVLGESALTAEAFNATLAAIVANELVMLHTGDVDRGGLQGAALGMVPGDAMTPHGEAHRPITQRDEDTKQVIWRLERWGVPAPMIADVVRQMG